MRKLGYIGVIVIFLGVVFLWQPFETEVADFDVSNAFEIKACESTEAKLTLEPLEVFEQPDGKLKTTLPNKYPVYFCGDFGEYKRIIFPQAGSKSDCSTRREGLCSFGFSKFPFQFLEPG